MISSVAEAVLDVLKNGMPPLVEPGQIHVCSPADGAESCRLGVFPYSVLKDTRYQMTGSLRVDGSVRQAPPLCVEMGIMVTAYAGKRSSLMDDYKLLERVLQIWSDISELPYSSVLQPAYVPPPRMELLSLNADEISKIWQFPGVPYSLSLFYKCAPIAIPSPRETVTPRVGHVDYSTKDESQ